MGGEASPYGDDIEIVDLGSGDLVIHLNEAVSSNGVNGWVRITIADWIDGGFRVEIHPEAEYGKTLEASRKWLLGVIKEEDFESSPNRIWAEFPWGYIYASYYPNKDYRWFGGDIQIHYYRNQKI